MRVIVDNKVHEALVDFYEVAKNRHVALGTRVIIRKMQRIYVGLEELGKYAMLALKPVCVRIGLIRDIKNALLKDFILLLKFSWMKKLESSSYMCTKLATVCFIGDEYVSYYSFYKVKRTYEKVIQPFCLPAGSVGLRVGPGEGGEA